MEIFFNFETNASEWDPWKSLFSINHYHGKSFVAAITDIQYFIDNLKKPGHRFDFNNLEKCFLSNFFTLWILLYLFIPTQNKTKQTNRELQTFQSNHNGGRRWIQLQNRIHWRPDHMRGHLLWQWHGIQVRRSWVHHQKLKPSRLQHDIW